jgi:hypothetical protein
MMMDEQAQKSKSGTVVRTLFADAKPIAMPLSRGPEPGQALNGVAPGEWREQADPYGMPPWCPVIPLGVSGNTGFFIDPAGQLQAFAKPYGKGDIIGLFLGDANYLTWAWPRYTKDGGIDGFAAEDATPVLMSACHAKGIWAAIEKLRGRGAWLSASGELLFHAGSHLELARREMPTGEFERYVYPSRPALPRPWPEKVDPASLRLLTPLLRSWNWERPDIDPVLLFGWIGAAWLGAAAPKRPVSFITGDKGTGKSTLQDLLKLLLGDALVQAADTSAAGIYQRIGQDCLPVAVDELESESDTRRQVAVLKLARLAYSGALMLRGGDRHQGVEFQARSCFLFSSINAPPLSPQDLSRMAILRLKKLPDNHPSIALHEPTLAMQGRMILRRMIDQWHRMGETWAAFKAELAAAGMDSRGQETFGTLLACQDMILHDGWDEERLRHPTAAGDLVPWRDLMQVDTMIEFEDQAENWRLCLDHMLSVPVEAWRNGTRRTVGQVLYDYYNSIDQMNLEQARILLAQAGLTIVMRDETLKSAWLAVPNQNPLTRTLFLGSKWAGDPGSAVWSGALRQGPSELWQVGRARVNGVVGRATVISLRGLYGPQGIMSLS